MFATHAGLYRYKRLLFGMNSPSKQNQYEISTALAGIADLDNILHNIIVHGPGSSIIVGLQAVKLQVCFVIHVEIGNIEKKIPNITFFTSINELVLLRNQ